MSSKKRYLNLINKISKINPRWGMKPKIEHAVSWITSGSELCELSPKKWTHKSSESGIKKERVEKMEKFTKEEKELLEQNPNIQAVLSNQVLKKKL